MKRLLAAGAVAALMSTAGIGIAQAKHNAEHEPGPGPNGHNDKGLCIAAQSGNKNGWDDSLPPPFNPDETEGYTRADFIEDFCDAFPAPGNRTGNPGNEYLVPPAE